jgi:hypothetical protein
MSDLDKFEEVGKEITEKISDYDIKILYNIFEASDPDIINTITEYCYGTVGIAENEIASILRKITSNYLAFYVAKFTEKNDIVIRKSLKEAQDRLDNLADFLEKKKEIRRTIK